MDEPNVTLPALPLPVIDWIEDEDLLRDEGVLFGLSDADADEKSGVIRHYFAAQTAFATAQLRFYELKTKLVFEQISEKETEKQQLTEKKMYYLQAKPEKSSDLPRSVLGLLLAVAACICNFYLIEQVFAPHFQQPVWVAAGVTLAGLFSLFARTSFFFTNPQSAPRHWKIWFEELLMPLAATAFVSVWAFETYPVAIAIALTIFVLGLFLISGKILLSLMTSIKTDFQDFVQERRFDHHARKMFRQTETDLALTELKLKDLYSEKDQLAEKTAPFHAQVVQVEARRDMLIKIFESEFYLSRSYKPRLTDQQRQELTAFKMKNG